MRSNCPEGRSFDVPMTYTEWVGARSGAPVWRATSDGNSQLVLPDAAMDLMWFDGQIVVAGPDTSAIAFDRAPGQATWGLRLAPGLAHETLGVSVHELANRRVPLDDIIATRGTRGAFASDIGDDLEAILLRLCERSAPDRARLALAGAIDTAARGGLTMRTAAKSVGLSERTLRRACSRWFGYGYKTLAMIHRFQRAVESVRAGASMVDAANWAGYADQAHFTRECRRLSGATPSVLLRPA